MRRKVIQIANSTQLVSLPRKWALEQGIKKGDEVDVSIHGSSLIINLGDKNIIERVSLNLSEVGLMAPRLIHALYKRGVDEIELNIQDPKDFQIIKKALNNETVGYEIVEQSASRCLVKNISGQAESFDTILRRVFRLLLTMSNEGLQAIKNKDFDVLRNTSQLEETNNRLTTVCRRYLNKVGKTSYNKIGPIYSIVEELEKIADEYKYLFMSIHEQNDEVTKLSQIFFSIYEDCDKFLNDFYTIFYKFDAKKLADLAEKRKQLVKDCLNLMESSKNKTEVISTHYLLVLTQKIFNLSGPYIILGF